jgi:hypothetical protein
MFSFYLSRGKKAEPEFGCKYNNCSVYVLNSRRYGQSALYFHYGIFGEIWDQNSGGSGVKFRPEWAGPKKPIPDKATKDTK